jgi:hypothetical protein
MQGEIAMGKCVQVLDEEVGIFKVSQHEQVTHNNQYKQEFLYRLFFATIHFISQQIGNNSTYYQQNKIVESKMKPEQIDGDSIASGQIIKIQGKSYQVPLSEVIVFGAKDVNNVEDKKESQKKCTVEEQPVFRVENKHMPVFISQFAYIVGQIYIIDLVKKRFQFLYFLK